MHVAKSSLGTVFNSHSHSTFHCVWIKNQQLLKPQNCFFRAASCCIPHYYGFTQQSQTFTFHSPWDGVEAEGLTFKQTAGLSYLGETKSANSAVSKGSLSTVKDPYGEKIIRNKCKKHKSTCIFGSIFIASSQRHIPQSLQAIWGRDRERMKRMSIENGSFGICRMQFIDFCNQTGIICTICTMQYRKSTILCWFI